MFWIGPAAGAVYVLAAGAALALLSGPVTGLVWAGLGLLVVVALGASVWAALRLQREHDRERTANQAAMAALETQAEDLRLAQAERDEHTSHAQNWQAALRFLEGHLAALETGQPVAARPEVSAETGSVLDRCVQMVEQARERHRDELEAAETVLAALGERVQSTMHRVQARMAVLMVDMTEQQSLLRCMDLDHEAAQAARFAQNVRVLCGGAPGQQWQNSLALEEAVRAAAGRMADYRRVNVPGASGLPLVPSAAETVIHVLAELLDNAARSSVPTTLVQVGVHPVELGAVIEIDDGGKGINDLDLDRWREIVTGRRWIRLVDLGPRPRTGFAVVARLARALELTVSLRHSAYGGLQVVVFIPRRLIQAVPALRQAAPAPAEPRWPAIDPPEESATSRAAQRQAQFWGSYLEKGREEA